MSADAHAEDPVVSVTGETRSRLTTLAAHLRVPLYRDGYALVLNSGLTALLGAGYWLLAAREYTPHAVGVNTAAISAMMFLAGVAQFNLMSALVRFLPILTATRARFIATCYGVAGIAAAACSGVFLLGARLWSPDLAVLGSSPGMVAWFVSGSVAWCVFNLQDSALTGLGAAVFVPLENFVYGVAKIVVLVALATVSPRFGIFASWTAALLFSLLPVNALIFAWLMRRGARDGAAPAAAVPNRREIINYVAPDYLGALLWLAATTLMPVIVIAIAGPTQNAYFSLAWMICLPLIAISSGTATALVASAAREPARLAEYARDVLRQTARMVLPAALIVAAGSPLILRLFGHAYAGHATVTLSLLALSAIPNMITALYVSVYRVQKRMRDVVRLLATLCGSVLVVAPVMLAAVGITGVGLTWVCAQTFTAVLLLVSDPHALAPRARDLIDLAADAGAIELLRSVKARRTRRRNAARLRRCLAPGSELRGVTTTVNDVIVGRVVDPNGSRSVLKLAVSDAGARSLLDACGELRAVHAAARLRSWARVCPRVVASGEVGERPYALETEMPGATVLARMDADAGSWLSLARSATGAIGELHVLTAREVTVGQELLARWIDVPEAALCDSVLGSSSARRRRAALRAVTADLRERLEGRELTVAWIHGDYVPENVLVDPRTGAVTGIVDWEMSARCDLPALDTLMFRLAGQAHLAHRDIGRIIAAVAAGDLDPVLRASLEEYRSVSPDPGLDLRGVTLLCWLRHAGALVTKSERYARHPVWKHVNVNQVLDACGP